MKREVSKHKRASETPLREEESRCRIARPGALQPAQFARTLQRAHRRGRRGKGAAPAHDGLTGYRARNAVHVMVQRIFVVHKCEEQPTGGEDEGQEDADSHAR